MGVGASVRRSDVDSPPPCRRVPAAVQSPPPPPSPPRHGWPPVDTAFLVLTAVVTPASIFLSAFFWVALYPHIAATSGGAPPPTHMVLEHGGNVALLLADAVISRVPVVSYHFQGVIVYGSIYVIFMWIWHGVREDWIYQTFDWHRPLAAAAYAVLPFLLAAAFALWYGVAAGREAGGRALERRRRRRGGEGTDVSTQPYGVEMVTPPRGSQV